MAEWWRNLTGGWKLSIILASVIVVGFWLFNTNAGKRILAYVGVLDCYELTLTGEVVCGDDADRVRDVKEGLGGVGDRMEDSGGGGFDALGAELDADAALAKRNIITENVRYSETDGFTVEVKVGRGLFAAGPDKVCEVMESEGYMPAEVVDARSGSTQRC